MTHHYQCQPCQTLIDQYPDISPREKLVGHAVRWPKKAITPFINAAKDLADQLNSDCPASPTPIAIPNGNQFDCISIDFAITESEDQKQLQPKLIELQAFPSIHHICLSLERGLSFTSQCLDGMSWRERNDRLRASLTLGLPKEQVVMLDQAPLGQRSALDFVLASDIVTVKAIDEVFLHNGRWSYLDQQQHPVAFSRIYNRCIFHTLTTKQQKKLKSMSESPDISWFAHPGWFYKLSKGAMPYLVHASIPDTREFKSLPLSDTDGWVLKDIDSVSGKGVVLHPSASDIAQAGERPLQHIWQERVQYAPWLHLPQVNTPMMAEMRVMLLRQPEGWMAISLMLRTAHHGHISDAMNNERHGEGVLVLMELAH